jgi:uncharacterized membrane protein (DUF4010 family)
MTLDTELIGFILTVVFSFLIGLELKAYKLRFHADEVHSFWGTTRTYTFTGMLGYLLYKIEPVHFSVYISGFFAITLLYALFYKNLLEKNKHSIVLYLVTLIVYTFGPIVTLFPIWMPSLIFVLIIFVLNAKQKLLQIKVKINTYEFETLGKMVLLSAVILPLLPDKTQIPYLGISFYKIWLSVVVISGISYAGYLVQTYLFPSKGIFLTGLIGGTYSSTATTVVLSKKVKILPKNHVITASIIAATCMMYLRLLVIAFIFNKEVAKSLFLPMVILVLFIAVVTFIYYKKGMKSTQVLQTEDKNPLELGTAFIFAFLFILMMLLSNFVISHYGWGGLKLLSSIVGFSDIDPFILSLLTGKYTVNLAQVSSAIWIASGSNNILKALYALWFGGKEKNIHSALWLFIFGVGAIFIGIIL